MSNLDGQTALVTGAGRGVGKGIALALARAGCRVAVNDLASSEDVEGTVAAVRSLGIEAFSVRANVGRSGEVERMLAEITARWERLNILVNNAGVQTWDPLLDVKESDWDRVVDTNLKGCFLCTQAAARHMAAMGGGAIVNIGSGCNKVPFPGLAPYTASKGGLEMLTRVAAVELGPSGIRVNCVAPGAIEIERTRRENPDYAAVWGRVTPLRRVGTPADVGAAVVFLASEDASFISGQTLWVDGALFSQAVWAY
jgi:NAD(P)-dependent dehydrogenase (short-subunit alcohol dehydrogenase family)